MRRTISVISALLLCLMMQGANKIVIGNATIPQGGEAAVAVQYELEEGRSFVGYAFKLAIPEGIATVKDEDGLPVYELDAQNQRFSLTVTANDGFGALPKSTSAALNGTEGTLLTLTLQAASSLPVGSTHIVSVNTIMLTEKTADGKMVSVPLDDFTFTVTIGEPDDGRLKFYETATRLPKYTAGDKADVTVQRTIKAGEWSTLVLPFNLTLANAKAAFGDDVQLAKYNGYTIDYGDDEENVTPLGIVIKVADYTIPARGNLKGGTPVLIKTSRDITEFQLDNVTLTEGVTDEQKADDDYDLAGRLTGSLVKATIPADGLFISNNQFWYSTGKTNVKAFRCWFELGAVLNEETDFGARVVLHFDHSEASAVQEVAIPSQHPQWLYDLQGRRVEKTTRKGLYIKDNKKVVVK